MYLEKYCITVNRYRFKTRLTIHSLLAQAVLKLTWCRFACVHILLYARSCVCAFARVQLCVLCLHYDAGLCTCIRLQVPTIFGITCTLHKMFALCVCVCMNRDCMDSNK